MADEIDTRISPTLHPGIAGEIADYDNDTRPLLGATETAVSEAFEALKSIHNAKAAAATNPTLNEFAQLIVVDSHATKLMDKVYTKWGKTVDVLNNNIAAMEKELYAPVEQRANASMASEIRAHFKALKPNERMLAVKTAIDDGDEITATRSSAGNPTCPVSTQNSTPNISATGIMRSAPSKRRRSGRCRLRRRC